MHRPCLLRLCYLLVLGPLLTLAITGCQPTPQGNVLGYLAGRQFDTLENPNAALPPGAIEGRVVHDGRPIAGATVVVAERTGRPHRARTDDEGYYRIEGVPPDQYTVAAVAPGYVEGALTGLAGTPALVTVTSNNTVAVPALALRSFLPPPLSGDLAEAVHLRQTAGYTATAPFPAGAAAEGRAFAFDHDGVAIDSLRLYLPLDAQPGKRFPLLLFIAPTAVDDWQNVSVGFASQGNAVVAISPVAARGVDADAQAQDARVALALARSGALGPEVGDNRPIAMGGSYSSAILARLLRAEGDALGGWVTVGGLADAFDGAADFYAGRLEMPPQFEFLVPAFGPPNLYPLPFLRYSPVDTASELPPTLIIHTAADLVLPIAQAYKLEEAARAAGVPVETYYYEDVSHYLGIGENLTDAGRRMFDQINEFVDRYGETE